MVCFVNVLTAAAPRGQDEEVASSATAELRAIVGFRLRDGEPSRKLAS